MPNANQRRGRDWERKLRDGFRAEGFDTEHFRDTGMKDEGDLLVRSSGGHMFVVEAKDAKLNVTGFLGEAEIECQHFAESRPYIADDKIHGVVAWKRRGKTFKGGVVMMDMATFMSILEAM